MDGANKLNNNFMNVRLAKDTSQYGTGNKKLDLPDRLSNQT